MKKLSIILAFILLSASVAFALGETETGNISTDVEKANVTTSSGFMGGKQDVNVGGVDVEGRTTDKMKTGNISTRQLRMSMLLHHLALRAEIRT